MNPTRGKIVGQIGLFSLSIQSFPSLRPVILTGLREGKL